ncbi:MFS transporter [Kitasatospora acidiphila]|uniref:MFS transporter n=1 Tax=Kitasatospora acidiphila TaxID=2567942 RepID=A0A540WB97_9ACTN|nr:MFS transporter [Kitasatospora acidiphila]TQF05674.1 MFS transporter [Kitasatospora acidiphila]
MAKRRSLGRNYHLLWGAYAVSAYGSGLGFGAFSLIAIRVLHAGSAQVSLLASAGLAVGAAIAVPLGPWVEFRRKRRVMVAMDAVRFAALLTIPAAYAIGRLSFLQLLVVAVVVAAAKIAFRAASSAYLKSLVAPEDLLAANAGFESTTWTSTVLGPPLGGAAIGWFGSVVTVLADAVSYLLSAVGIAAIRHREPQPAPPSSPRAGGGLLDGWRHILGHPVLRPLFLNSVLFNALIMATEPLLSVLMLGRLGFAPWQYTLAFATPCLGGLLGSRLSKRVVDRYGRHRVLLVGGTLRACWPIGLAFIGSGTGGMLLVIVLQFALILFIGITNPVLATMRLDHTEQHLVARTISAWSITSSATIAALTALWGLLAAVTGPRTAIAAAGLLLLATPLLLPRQSPMEITTLPNAAAEA